MFKTGEKVRVAVPVAHRDLYVELDGREGVVRFISTSGRVHVELIDGGTAVVEPGWLIRVDVTLESIIYGPKGKRVSAHHIAQRLLNAYERQWAFCRPLAVSLEEGLDLGFPLARMIVDFKAIKSLTEEGYYAIAESIPPVEADYVLEDVPANELKLGDQIIHNQKVHYFSRAEAPLPSGATVIHFSNRTTHFIPQPDAKLTRVRRSN